MRSHNYEHAPDQMHYSPALVDILMNDALNPAFAGARTLGVDDSNPYGHQARALNEGGNWMAMVFDVRRAMKALPWTFEIFTVGPAVREPEALDAIVEFLGGPHPMRNRTNEGNSVNDAIDERRPVQERASKRPKPTATQGQWLTGDGGFHSREA